MCNIIPLPLTAAYSHHLKCVPSNVYPEIPLSLSTVNTHSYSYATDPHTQSSGVTHTFYSSVSLMHFKVEIVFHSFGGQYVLYGDIPKKGWFKF